MTNEPETEIVPVDRFADLLPGDVVVETDRTYDGDLVRVRRELPPKPAQPDAVEGTIANFYGRPHVLLKRGRTLIASADRHSGDPLIPGVGKNAALNNKLIWVSIDNGWSFREYNSPIDTQTPEIIYTPGEAPTTKVDEAAFQNLISNLLYRYDHEEHFGVVSFTRRLLTFLKEGN